MNKLKAEVRRWGKRRKRRAARLRRIVNRPVTKRFTKERKADAVRRATHRLKVAKAMHRKKKAQLESAYRRLPLRTKALFEAQKLIGVMESGGNNSGTKVLEIIRANGGSGPEPWCGDFVAWCYRRAGSKAVQRGWAAVRLLGFLSGMRVISLKRAEGGDIICFSFDHTGLYVCDCDANGKPEAGGAYILTVEGNTGASGAVSDSRTGGDGVYKKTRHKSLVSRAVRVRR